MRDVVLIDNGGANIGDILVEMGRRGMVGGQEDMIEDTALTLARRRSAPLASVHAASGC